MESLIDELLDTYDSINKDTDASRIDKETILVTLGFGKRGDKKSISVKDIESWRKARDDYLKASRENHSHAESLRVLFLAMTLDMISRCFMSENAEALFDKLHSRWEK